MNLLRRVRGRVAGARVFACAAALLFVGAGFVPGSAVVAAGQTENTAYTELAIGGMTCDACVARVKDALSAVPGVLEVTVSLDDARAALVLDGAAIPAQETLIQCVADAGFKAESAVGREYGEYAAFESGADDSVDTATTGRATELHELSKDARELKDVFNRDADKVRLVVLLSPT